MAGNIRDICGDAILRRIDRKLLLHMLTGPGLLIGALLWLYWRIR